MKGTLAVNHFLVSAKFSELHSRLIEAAKKENIELELKTNLELATKSTQCDFVLFWDKDINLARRLEKEGLPVFNCAESIEKCDDKARTYIELLGTVPQPKTLIAPKTYFKADFTEFVDNAIEILGLPLVFKECFGSFGEQVFLCKTKDKTEIEIEQDEITKKRKHPRVRGPEKTGADTAVSEMVMADSF